MKLAIYLPNLASGGIERMHINLAPAFVAAGFDVVFVLHQSEGALMGYVPAGVRVVSLHCHRTLECIAPLARFLRSEKPDILLSNLGHNNIVAIWAAMLARSPTRIIASYHRALSAESGAGANWQHRLLPLLCRLFLGQAHGIVAVSKGVADDLAARAGLARARVSVIYNPVVFQDFDNRMREPITHPWLAADAPPFIVGVGRLVEQKDFATLISAFALVSRSRDTRLMLIGEGPLQHNLMAQAQSYGIADRVNFAGFQANPLPFMHKALALVLSSTHEGFGNVLVEALACGTPVVSTDCPYGPAEILEGGRYGALVSVGDSKALAASIMTTLESPLPREMLRARGREFTVERSLNAYFRLFKTLSVG